MWRRRRRQDPPSRPSLSSVSLPRLAAAGRGEHVGGALPGEVIVAEAAPLWPWHVMTTSSTRRSRQLTFLVVKAGHCHAAAGGRRPGGANLEAPRNSHLDEQPRRLGLHPVDRVAARLEQRRAVRDAAVAARLLRRGRRRARRRGRRGLGARARLAVTYPPSEWSRHPDPYAPHSVLSTTRHDATRTRLGHEPAWRLRVIVVVKATRSFSTRRASGTSLAAEDDSSATTRAISHL